MLNIYLINQRFPRTITCGDKVIDIKDLKPGDVIRFLDSEGYDCDKVMVDFTCQKIVVIRKTTTIVEMYVNAIDEVFAGCFSSCCGMVALNLEGCKSLDNEGKETLCRLLKEKYNSNVVIKTKAELISEGLISDAGTLYEYFNTGNIISIWESAIDNTHFTFSLERYKGYLNIDFYMNSEATKTNNEWNYKLGSRIVS